jgi:hypothetical protein
MLVQFGDASKAPDVLGFFVDRRYDFVDSMTHKLDSLRQSFVPLGQSLDSFVDCHLSPVSSVTGFLRTKLASGAMGEAMLRVVSAVGIEPTTY